MRCAVAVVTLAVGGGAVSVRYSDLKKLDQSQNLEAASPKWMNHYSTPCKDVGHDGGVKDLAQFPLECQTSGALNSFKFTRCGENGDAFRYRYDCTMNMLVASSHKIRVTECTPINNQTVDVRNGSFAHLSLQSFKCSQGEALRGFVLQHAECPDQHVRYQYTCGEAEWLQATQTGSSTCGEVLRTNVHNADRHFVNCPQNTAMISMGLSSNGCEESRMHYEYICGGQFSAEQPDDQGSGIDIDFDEASGNIDTANNTAN